LPSISAFITETKKTNAPALAAYENKNLGLAIKIFNVWLLTRRPKSKFGK